MIHLVDLSVAICGSNHSILQAKITKQNKKNNNNITKKQQKKTFPNPKSNNVIVVQISNIVVWFSDFCLTLFNQFELIVNRLLAFSPSKIFNNLHLSAINNKKKVMKNSQVVLLLCFSIFLSISPSFSLSFSLFLM